LGHVGVRDNASGRKKYQSNNEEQLSAWFKLRSQSRARQEAEFISKKAETRFLTGVALLSNAHRIEPRPIVPIARE